MTKKVKRNWSEEDLDFIRKGIVQGLSATEMGAKLGVSRCAVLGVAHRNNISLSGGMKKKEMAGSTKIKVGAKKMNQVPSSTMASRELEALKTASIFADKQEGSLFALPRKGKCKFIFGDVKKDFKYCGEEAKPGAPYCEEHTLYCRMDERTRRSLWHSKYSST